MICSMIVIVGSVIAGIVLFNHENLFKDEIIVSNWDGMQERYCMGMVKMREGNTNFSECYHAFFSDSDVFQILKQENKDFVKEIDYIHDDNRIPTLLFYHSGNYYMIYYDSDNGFYMAQNCYGKYRLSDSIIYFPFLPVYMNLSYGTFEIYQEFGDNIFDYLYNNYSFEEAAEYFKRLEEENLVTIDQEKKCISITAYDVYSHEKMKDYVTFNFKDRTVIGPDEDGNIITVDGTEKGEESD